MDLPFNREGGIPFVKRMISATQVRASIHVKCCEAVERVSWFEVQPEPLRCNECDDGGAATGSSLLFCKVLGDDSIVVVLLGNSVNELGKAPGIALEQVRIG